MKKYVLLSLLLLAACVQNRMLYVNEKGNQVYQSKCNGGMLDMGDCMADAAAHCPNGFEVIQSSESNMGQVMQANAQSSSSANANATFFGNTLWSNTNGTSNFNGNGYSFNVFNRYMIYSCK